MNAPEEPRRFDDTVNLDDDAVVSSSDLHNPAVLDDPLAALRASVVAEVISDDLVLKVDKRPGMTVRYSTNIDMDFIQRWRRSCHDKSQPDNFNQLKFSLLILANTAKAMGLSGVEPAGSNGQPLTFISPELAEWTGQKRALDVARALYASDGNVMASAQEVLDAAGYGDEAKEPDEDPTRRP